MARDVFDEDIDYSESALRSEAFRERASHANGAGRKRNVSFEGIAA
jgi:hypothetical protein